MADISVTAASVVQGAGAIVTNQYNAGETLTAGQSIYLSASSLWMKAQSDGTIVEAGSGSLAVALNGAAVNQPVTAITGGLLTIGATVVAGTTYCVSTNAGGICPDADITAGFYKSILGVATTSGIINLKPWATGIAHA